MTVQRGGRCVHSLDLSNLLPEDRISRDDVFPYIRSELVERLDVPGNPRYYAMAQLDRAMGVDRYLHGGRLLGYLESGLGYPPSLADPFRGAGVRFNAYAKEQGSKGRLVVHGVNYNLPLVEDGQDRGIIPVEKLELQVRLPERWEIQRVQALEPGVSPEPLTFKTEDRFLKTALPTIKFYKMIHISGVLKQ